MSKVESGESPRVQNSSNPLMQGNEQISCGIVAFDRHLHVTAMNRKAEELLSLEKGRAAAPESLELLPEVLQSLVEGAAMANKPETGRVVMLAKAGQPACRVFAGTTLARGANGQFDGVILTLLAMERPPECEENIRRQGRLAALGTLSASMAHEIKNALVAGKTFLDLLLEKHQQSELTEIVRREMDRIDSIVSQILRYSAPGRPNYTDTSLHDVIEHSLKLVTPSLDCQMIRVEKLLNAERDVVRGSNYQLQQAFVNLLLNAQEAMPPNGMLKVATRFVPEAAAGGGGFIEVQLSDTGSGILPENLDRLFQPFFTTKRSGTGLGLAITQRIFQEHGGTISVRSKLNEGTEFTIELPVAEKD
ncbi:MAG TPA: ATP-binding protein [Verrucomicrobiae bacterium]|nr:ATP-binding protein [Verrucomicrobiae bacterium]